MSGQEFNHKELLKVEELEKEIRASLGKVFAISAHEVHMHDAIIKLKELVKITKEHILK